MYRIDGGAPQGYTGPFDFATEGEHTLEYRSIDGAGNAENYRRSTLKVDAKAPRRRPRSPSRASARDRLVGQRGDGRSATPPTVQAPARRRPSTASTDAEWLPYTAPFRSSAVRARSTVQYRSTDAAGNVETEKALQHSRRRDRADHDRATQRRRPGGGLRGPGARGLHPQRRRGQLGRRGDRVPRQRRRVDGLRGRVRPLRATGATRSTSARSISSATSRTSSECGSRSGRRRSSPAPPRTGSGRLRRREAVRGARDRWPPSSPRSARCAPGKFKVNVSCRASRAAR